MYYIYKIENLINHKKYIGLTNNIARRRARHFTDLKCGRHDNSFLQKEYKIFGANNFSFEILYEGEITSEEASKKEVFYIKQYDSYLNGYNQNEGGNFGPSNGGSHLTKTDIFNICSALEFSSRPGGVLSKMYDVSLTTISRIKHKENHIEIIEEYEKLPPEDRLNIYQIFCDSSQYNIVKANQTIIKSKRKLTEEQVFMVLANKEFKVIPKVRLAKMLNIKSTNTFSCIEKGHSYQDYILKYKEINNEKKQQIVSLLSN